MNLETLATVGQAIYENHRFNSAIASWTGLPLHTVKKATAELRKMGIIREHYRGPYGILNVHTSKPVITDHAIYKLDTLFREPLSWVTENTMTMELKRLGLNRDTLFLLKASGMLFQSPTGHFRRTQFWLDSVR